jgi:uncharacterized protein (DUF1778 family)
MEKEKFLQVRVTPEFHKRLKRAAAALGLSSSSFVVMTVTKEINRLESTGELQKESDE